jgi:hypothetical protein
MATLKLSRTFAERVGLTEVACSGDTMLETLRYAEATYPDLKGVFFKSSGELRPSVAVFRNGVQVWSRDPVSPADVLEFVFQQSGG